MKLFGIAALVAIVSAEDRCCTVCSGAGIEKTYSIDPIAGHCGESCIPITKFWLYHIFEAWLTVAENGNASSPCKEHGFTEYCKLKLTVSQMFLMSKLISGTNLRKLQML